MALVNTDYMMSEYIDDFGNKYPNVFFKIQNNAPKLDVIYSKRPETLGCGGNLIFKPRHLEVVFNDGRKLIYPINKISDIKDTVAILRPSLLDNALPGDGDDEAACINLVGEKWTLLTPRAIGTLEFRTAPYTNIPNRGIKETGTYDYASDLLGKLGLSYAIESKPDDLLKCQKEGLKDAKSGKGICSGAGIGIKPRRLIIQAQAKSGENLSSVVRNVNVSEIGKLKEVAGKIKGCANCLGYQGESIPNLQNLISDQTIGG